VPRGVALARAGAHTATSRVRRSTVPNGRITSHRHPSSVVIRSRRRKNEKEAFSYYDIF